MASDDGHDYYLKAMRQLNKLGHVDFFGQEKPESPAEKAKRIGVPVIPAYDNARQRQIHDPNPIMAVCGQCGIEMRRVMAYCCPRSNCPCFPNITC